MSRFLAMPAIPGVASLDWSLTRNVSPYPNTLSRTVQRTIRDGDLWLASLRFPLYTDDDAGVLRSWLDQLSRGDAWTYLAPPHNSVRGAWNPQELLTNGDLKTGLTTGWTATSTALSVNARRLKIANTAAGTGSANQNVTMEAGKPHVLMSDYAAGTAASTVMRVQRQSDSVVEATLTLSAAGRGVLLITPTVAAMRPVFIVNEAVSGKYVYHSNMSLCRCLQVNGAGQTGNSLAVDGGPASTNAAIKAGQFVSLRVGDRWQLLRLSDDFDTDSSGAGTLVFEPTLRDVPADNAAVMVRNPFGRFMLPDQVSRASITAPLYDGFACDLVEDPTVTAGEIQ